MTVRRIERLNVSYRVELYPGGRVASPCYVTYTPVADGETLRDISGSFTYPWGDPTLLERVGELVRALEARADRQQFEIDGGVVDVQFTLSSLEVDVGDRFLTLRFSPGGSLKVSPAELTSAQRRLLDSINGTISRVSWEDLRRRLNVAEPSRKGLQVFISYRVGHDKFAEALANRLGQEGIVLWFDKWDIQAGDSVPGKIEEGLRDSIAFIPIITADYEQGRWATEELRNAIAKRIEQGYAIIPVLLEGCERPELIRHLRYVDFSGQDPEAFESKFAELIDGIYGLELNPFR